MVTNRVIRIQRKSDDPGAPVRISLGAVSLDPVAGYVVYRGSKDDAIVYMEHALAAMKNLAVSLGSGEQQITED